MKIKTFEEYLEEEIKGWKHAHSDIMRSRAEVGKNVTLHKLTKDGKESGMHDAKKSFRSEEEAIKHHENIKNLNPNKKISHNLYVNGEMKRVLN